MISVASLSGGFPPRPSVDDPAAALGSVGVPAAGESGIEEMLLGLEEESLRYRVALRVQSEGAASQPLARIDVTDLALMIITGGVMSRALDAAPAISSAPGAYRQSY